MAELKNIIFDLGGVLLDINYTKTEKAFNQLGFKEFKNMYSQYNANTLFEDLETGSITNKSFYEAIINISPLPISSNQITEAWNAMLLHFRTESLYFLENISSRYRLFLLSNTNAIHLQAFQDIFVKETGKVLLDDYFTKAYYSHRVGLRKPNADIFEFVLKDADILAGESLFIDDSINNVQAAKSLGFLTHLLVSDEKIESLAYFSGNHFTSSNSI